MTSTTQTQIPTVKCGNTSAHPTYDRYSGLGYHYTPAQVRECYAASGRFSAPAKARNPLDRSVMFTCLLNASPEFGKRTNDQNAPVIAAALTAWYDSTSTDMYAFATQWLASHPAPAAPKPAPAPRVDYSVIGVNDQGWGLYALTNDEGVIHFYRVERPSTGKWAGRTFVKEQVSDILHKVEVPRCYRVLDAIAANPTAAGRLYAKEMVHCYRCGKRLTVTQSRTLGLGPVCATKAWS